MADYRRRLPHFHPDVEYPFVTWRLYGSLPVAPPDVIFATPGHAFASQDRVLAKSLGARWLSDSRVARLIAETIRHGERQMRFYESEAWVIMPNHVHLRSWRKWTFAKSRIGSKGEWPRRRIDCWAGCMSPTITE